MYAGNVPVCAWFLQEVLRHEQLQTLLFDEHVVMLMDTAVSCVMPTQLPLPDPGISTDILAAAGLQ
jgi:hypothetical protein